MCLFVVGNKKTAKKDIVVYKEVICLGDRTVVHAPIFNFAYHVGSTYTSTIKITDGRVNKNLFLKYNGRVIENGFHASVKRTRSRDVKFVIPKGSIYYLGLYNEIVSDYIKYVGV